MNVLFVSPHFPSHFYHFCAELKALGANVLGVGDAPYEEIGDRCRAALTEYYRVGSLEDYDAVHRAAAFFIHKYGRLDFVEGQNEYWLVTEAQLREDFNVAHGFRPADLATVKRKSRMKAGYERAGVKTARYCVVEGPGVKSVAAVRRFAKKCGFPLVAKPDKGVGAANTYKINGSEELDAFLFNKPDDVPYIVEEFVPGHVETYDGIVDAGGEVVFAASQRMWVTPLAMLQGDGENVSVTQPLAGTDLEKTGRATVRGFGLVSEFFHFEFIRLDRDKAGLGRKGEIVGLEVNLRAPGGYIPDKMNFAHNVDVYRIWAETLVRGTSVSFRDFRFTWYVTHFARGGAVKYRHGVDEVRAKYAGGDRWLFDSVPAAVLSGGMGAYAALLRAGSPDEVREQADYILEHAE